MSADKQPKSTTSGKNNTPAPSTYSTGDGYEEILGRPTPSVIQADRLRGPTQPGHVRGSGNTWLLDHGVNSQFG